MLKQNSKEKMMGRPRCKCKVCGIMYDYGEDGKGTTWNYCSWACHEASKK